MVGKILQPEIKSLIDARDFAALREIFREWPPADVAEVILDLPEDEQVIIFRVLPHGSGGGCFRISRSRGATDVAARDGARAGRRHSERDVAGRSHGAARRIAERGGAPVDRAAHAGGASCRSRRCSVIPKDSVGRLMTPDFIAVHEDWTVQHVLDYIRENGQDSETLNVIYVVDERGKLIDDLRMREFLLRPLDARRSAIDSRRHIRGPEGDRFPGGSAQRFPEIRSHRACRWLIRTAFLLES